MKGKPIEPGCLALVVFAPRTPENIGKVVRVVAAASPGYVPSALRGRVKPLRENLGPVWVVRSERGADLLVQVYSAKRGRDAVLWRELCDERAFAARCLRRLDDGEDYSHETTDKQLDKPLEHTS